VSIERSRRSQPHRGGDLLAEIGVGEADDGDVGDVRVLVQDRLDVRSRDVLTGADHDVLGATVMYSRPSTSLPRSPVWTNPSASITVGSGGSFQ